MYSYASFLDFNYALEEILQMHGKNHSSQQRLYNEIQVFLSPLT